MTATEIATEARSLRKMVREADAAAEKLAAQGDFETAAYFQAKSARMAGALRNLRRAA